ncbi:NDR and related serine/threonine kinases [Moesziomyces antarcticus T-34]|uniref:non-specific serine/threonine protein kinase n=1 Tax=Pseudozyma antarctica (strain T-34) TaxID=1151754 RepID=M9MFS3_PSEA3|nr:NDR and related serine/threonine kinases [Moesziomyces antarcticus T-34]
MPPARLTTLVTPLIRSSSFRFMLGGAASSWLHDVSWLARHSHASPVHGIHRGLMLRFGGMDRWALASTLAEFRAPRALAFLSLLLAAAASALDLANFAGAFWLAWAQFRTHVRSLASFVHPACIGIVLDPGSLPPLTISLSATHFTDPFSAANRTRISPGASDPSRLGASSFAGDAEAYDPKSSPSSTGPSPSPSSSLSQAAATHSRRSTLDQLQPSTSPTSPPSAPGKHSRSDQSPSPTRSFKHSRIASDDHSPPSASASATTPAEPVATPSAAQPPPQSHSQGASQQPVSASSVHASTSPPAANASLSTSSPGFSLSPPSAAAYKALGRSSSKRMSFDTAPSFSSPLAFASILPNDDDINDDEAQLNHDDAPAPASATWMPRARGSTSPSQGSVAHHLSPTSPSSISSASSSQPGRRQRRQTGSDSAASDTVDEASQRSSARRDVSQTAAGATPTTAEGAAAAAATGASSLARTSIRLDRERATSNPLHRAVTGASRLNRTPSRHSPFQSFGVVDDDASSVASDDVATTGSNLTRKSSVTSSTGSMGPPAVPRRIAAGATGSPALEPVDRPASTIAMGKRKEDSSLGLGIPLNPSPLSSGSSVGLPASSSFHSGSPTLGWETRGARSSSGAFAPSSFGAAAASTTPSNTTAGGSAILHSTRRRRMTSSSLSSSAHRRARSLGGVLLGEGAVSPVGGPDGVDPNLIAAIESGSPSIPLPVSIPNAPTSHRSGSVSSSGTQGAASSLSSSSLAPSSVPFGSSLVARASLHRKRNSQVIDDDDLPRGDSSGSQPSPGYTRSRVRSQTLGVPPSSLAPASATSPAEAPSTMLAPSPSGKSTGSAGLADAIRLQRVPTAVRLAGDLFVPASPSPRTMPKSASTASMESPLGRWSSHNQHGGSLALGSSGQGHGLGLGLTSDAPSASAQSSRLNVPQTPNATRSNSPLASEYTYSADDAAIASGRTSPAVERLRTDGLAMPGHDSRGQPLSVSIPIGRDYGPTASLPGSAIFGSRSPGVPPTATDHLDVPTSVPRHAGLSASTSAYSPLLSLGASSAQTSPTTTRRPTLSPSRSSTQRMSWGAQELFDSLVETNEASEDGRSNTPVSSDKPAPWIASTQDAPPRTSLAPAAATISQRRATQSNLSSSFGSNALLAIPPPARRVHRPSDAALFTPGGISPAASNQPLSGTDEYARIIIQSRNAKMQKWRAQNPSRLGRGDAVAAAAPGRAGQDRSQDGQADGTLFGQASLGRRGTTIGLQRDASLLDAMRARRGSAVDSNDSIESQLDEEEEGHRGLESSAFAEFEWVDWLDEYRKMKEAKLQSEREEAEAQAAVETGATASADKSADSKEGGTPDKAMQASIKASASAARRMGSEAGDASRVAALQKQPADGHRSVSDPLTRQRLQTAEAGDSEQDAIDAQEVEASLAALSLNEDSPGAKAAPARASKPPQLGPARRPDGPSRQGSRPGIDPRRSFSLASAELARRGSGPGSAAASTLASSPGPVKAGFSPVKRLGTDKSKNLSLSPITSRVKPSAQYTSTLGSESASSHVHAHAAGRGRRKHLGGKIEAWWSAVKSGFTAPAGEGWAKAPSTASPRANEGASRTTSVAALSQSLHQSPAATAARRDAPLHTRRDAPRPMPLSASSSTAQPTIAVPSPTLVTQVQSGFGRHVRSQTGNTALSGTESVRTLRPSTSAQNLWKDRGARDEERGTDDVDEAAAADRSDRLSVSPGAEASFVTVQEDTSALEPPQSASSQQSQDTHLTVSSSGREGSSSGRRRHQPKLSLQLEKGLSTFDAEEFDKIGKGKSPSNSDRGSPTKTPLSAKSNESGSSEKEAARMLMPVKADSPAVSPRKSSLQLSQAWNPSTRASPAKPPQELPDRDAAFESDNDGRATARAKAASKAITINSIRQHIRHRLLASKESCDRELRRIIGAINNYVELELERQEDDGRHSFADDNRDIEELEEVFVDDADDADDADEAPGAAAGGGADETPASTSSVSRSASMSRAASNSSSFSAGAAAAAAAITGSAAVTQPDEGHAEGGDANEASTEPHARSPSASLFTSPSLGGLREAAALRSAREYKLPAPPPVNLAGATATSPRTITTPTSNPAKPSNLNPLGRAKSLSRSGARSLSNSRSTSRSHSPMPGVMMTSSVSASSGSPRLSPSRRTRALPAEEAGPKPWMQPLEELVAVAMDVLDVSINSLIVRPGSCSQLIARIQTIGRLWDVHPEWAGRGWFIQILLAVAGLSRVVEWWEAEKGFWNFNDEDEQDAEPIRFILGGQNNEAPGEAHDNDTARSSAFWLPSTASSPTRARAFSVAQDKSTSGTDSPASGLLLRDSELDREAAQRFASPGKGLADSAAVHDQSAEDADADGDMTIVDRARQPPQRQTSAEADGEDESRVLTEAISRMQIDERDERDGDDQEVEDVEQHDDADTATPPAPQRFRSAGINVLMELSMDDQRFLYLSPAWKTVLGSDPAELYDTPVEDLLAPGDTDVFAEASRQLEANQSHTVEAVFRLRVEKALVSSSSSAASTDGQSEGSDAVYFQEMEGKGMLMIDRQSGVPSHSMWVFKATGPPERQDRLPEAPLTKGGRALGVVMDEPTAALAHVASISVEPVLCRICERDIPAWFFEKHSEICNETHRLDMEIGECNEGLRELRKAIQDLHNRLENFSTQKADAPPLEYRGGLNRSISPRQPAPAAVRKLHLRALDSAIEVLQTACDISTPAIKDEFADEPIEKQRLLSPTSENKVVTVQQWRRPPLDDTALDLLMADVETAMRGKLSAVNRMLNTIVYVETVRQEWEERVEAALSALSEADEASGSSRGSSASASDSGGEDVSEEASDQGGQAAGEAAPTGVQVEQDLATGAAPVASEADAKSTAPAVLETSSKEDAPATTKPDAPQSSPLRGQAVRPPHSRLVSTLSSSAADDEAEARQEDGAEEEDGLLSGSMLLEQDDRDLPAPTSTLFSAMGGATPDEDDIPAVDDKMGGSSHLAPIPIPRSSGGLAPPPATELLAPRSVSGAIAAGPSQRRSVSRPRRSSHLPPPSDGFGGTPPLSPHMYGESLGVSHRHHRKFSVSHKSPMAGSMPLSPRIPPAAPSSRPTASSIKDFDIIKPISKGAFGSVFLAKKRTTGDYYAIKVLKKSDMIAKNQITNVKAERMILMTQNQSPFVVKLFFTFQSAEFLYLVMEYLPGGDCASLCKVLGGLSEEWARQYIAEVVIGLQHLHSKGVVHRDLKPDNLLIDQKGHLKLTDFGLSKIGLLGRQTRQAAVAAASSSAGGAFAGKAQAGEGGKKAVPRGFANALGSASAAAATAAASPTAAVSPTQVMSALPATVGGTGHGEEIACLIAEDNPIALRMLETILVKLGCRCVAVRDGAEAVRLAMGESKFGVMFIDVTLPIVGGQDVTRMVKSTRNVNSTTPIVALASFDRGEPVDAAGSLFDAVLAKPLEKMDVCATLSQLGFTPTQGAAAAETGSGQATGEASGVVSGTASAGPDSRPLSRKSTLARKTAGSAARPSTPPATAAAGAAGAGAGGSGHHTPYSSSPLGSSVLSSRLMEATGKAGRHPLTRRMGEEGGARDQDTAETLSKVAERLSLT